MAGIVSRQPPPSGRTGARLSAHRRSTPILPAPALAAGLAGPRVVVGAVVALVAPRLFPRAGRVAGPPLVGAFHHWDAGFYLLIAEVGYPHDRPAMASFFPFYPLVVRVVARLGPLSFGASAIAVSWVGLFAAAWGMVVLARTLWPNRDRAGLIAGLLVWAPGSVFLIGQYPEAVYCALLAWAFVKLVRHQPWQATALAALAGATEPEGAFVGVVVFVTLLAWRRYLLAWACGALSEIGALAVSVFYRIHYGRLLADVYAQEHYWSRGATWPFHPLAWSLRDLLIGPYAHQLAPTTEGMAVFSLDDLMIVAATAAACWLAVQAWRDHRLAPLFLFSALYLLVVVSNGPARRTPEADERVIMCIVPLYLAARGLPRVWLRAAALILSAGLAIVFQALFNIGQWLT